MLNKIPEGVWLMVIGLMVFWVVVVCAIAYFSKPTTPATKSISFEDRNYFCREVKQRGFSNDYIITCTPIK